MKKIIIEYILSKPKQALIISLLIFGACLPGVLMLKEEFGYKAWYAKDDPLMELYRNFERKFGNDDSVMIAVYNPKGLINENDLKVIGELTEKLWLVEDIFRVDSISNYDLITSNKDEITVAPLIDAEKKIDPEDIKRKLKSDKLIQGLYINEDFTMSIIQGFLRPAFEDPPDYSVVTQNVEKMLKPFQDKGLDIRIMGGVALSHYFKSVSVDDINTLLPIVGVLFCLVLIVIYKRVSGVVLPYVVVATSVLTMMGLAGYLGKTINMLSSAAPTILLTVAIADAIHMMTSYYFARGEGQEHLKAVRYTLEKNFFPTLFTSLTTVVGFISFANAKVKAIADIGVMISIGVVFAWYYSYFILGSILTMLPLKTKIKKKAKMDLINGKNLNGLIKNHKGKIVLLTIILIITSIFYSLKLEVNMDPVSQFKPSHPLYKSVALITEKMGSFSTMEMKIDSGKVDGVKEPAFLKKVEELEKWLVSQPNIAKTFSINDIIKQFNKIYNGGDESFYKIPDDKNIIAEELFFYTLGLPQGRDLNNRVSIDNRHLRLSVSWSIRDSLTANRYMDKVRAKAQEIDLDLVITGKMPLFHDLTSYIVSTFFDSFLIAIIGITLILYFILKSFKLAAIALIPNLLPLLVGGLLYYLSGNYVDVGTVIVASVCLGIAVDDSIHFLFEYRRYRTDKLNVSDSIEKLIKTTYPSLLFTTMTIFIGFGSFAFAQYVPNARFGIMVSLILVVALLADFFILPAILYYTDKDKKYE